MGADQFITSATGRDAQEAFKVARDSARFENGHGGYTGTIAEKDAYVIIPRRSALDYDRETAEMIAERLLAMDDRRISDKWGPAGAIQYDDPDAGPGQQSWLFFGYASS